MTFQVFLIGWLWQFSAEVIQLLLEDGHHVTCMIVDATGSSLDKHDRLAHSQQQRHKHKDKRYYLLRKLELRYRERLMVSLTPQAELTQTDVTEAITAHYKQVGIDRAYILHLLEPNMNLAKTRIASIYQDTFFGATDAMNRLGISRILIISSSLFLYTPKHLNFELPLQWAEAIGAQSPFGIALTIAMKRCSEYLENTTNLVFVQLCPGPTELAPSNKRTAVSVIYSETTEHGGPEAWSWPISTDNLAHVVADHLSHNHCTVISERQKAWCYNRSCGQGPLGPVGKLYNATAKRNPSTYQPCFTRPRETVGFANVVLDHPYSRWGSAKAGYRPLQTAKTQNLSVRALRTESRRNVVAAVVAASLMKNNSA